MSETLRRGDAPTEDGRRLHYIEAGTGTPVVVFEAGMGASGRCWATVQELVAVRTRAVLYDRAGLGRSDRDRAPRTLPRAADDLVQLLDHLGPRPFVLVGHSWGGPIVRVAAQRRRAQVAGLVLVDPTDEGCDLYFSGPAMRQQRALVALLPFAARLGLTRRLAKRGARFLPDWARDDLPAQDGSVAAARAFQGELGSLVADLQLLRAEPPELGDLPVTIISGTRRPRLGARQRAALIASHEARARGLPAGRHVRAERSGHLVPFTEPHVIAAEILRIAEAP